MSHFVGQMLKEVTTRPLILRPLPLKAAKIGFYKLRTHHTPYISLNPQSGSGAEISEEWDNTGTRLKGRSQFCLSVVQTKPLVVDEKRLLSRSGSIVILSGFSLTNHSGEEDKSPPDHARRKKRIATFQSDAISISAEIILPQSNFPAAGGLSTPTDEKRLSQTFGRKDNLSIITQTPLETQVAAVESNSTSNKKQLGRLTPQVEHEDESQEPMAFVIRKKARDLWDT